jgi:hypothetical protein
MRSERLQVVPVFGQAQPKKCHDLFLPVSPCPVLERDPANLR